MELADTRKHVRDCERHLNKKEYSLKLVPDNLAESYIIYQRKKVEAILQQIRELAKMELPGYTNEMVDF